LRAGASLSQKEAAVRDVTNKLRASKIVLARADEVIE
jgi:hypothetical protein